MSTWWVLWVVESQFLRISYNLCVKKVKFSSDLRKSFSQSVRASPDEVKYITQSSLKVRLIVKSIGFQPEFKLCTYLGIVEPLTSSVDFIATTHPNKGIVNIPIKLREVNVPLKYTKVENRSNKNLFNKNGKSWKLIIVKDKGQYYALSSCSFLHFTFMIF